MNSHVATIVATYNETRLIAVSDGESITDAVYGALNYAHWADYLSSRDIRVCVVLDAKPILVCTLDQFHALY
jgi:hypothetical protein